MVRTSIEVVSVRAGEERDEDLVRELTGLWMAQRVDQGASPEAAARAVAEGRLREALRRCDVRAWLARLEEAPVGYLIVSENPFGLAPHPEVAIEQLFVDRRVRRRGVGHALLDAVVAYAERLGAEVVATHVPTQSRDANRFFARLGFGSVVVRRVVPTATLRRKLHPEAKPELVAMLRRRRGLAPAPLRRPIG